MSTEVVYTSRVHIERVSGPLRRVHLPAEKEPVWLGTHGEIAAHYQHDPAVHDPHATTLDYVVAATAG
jgi:hypothetical protein